jgi:hypothetical protein
LVRCLEGVGATDALRQLKPMNCLSWIVGHLANQEHFLWVLVAQGQNLAPDLHRRVGYGQPASTPPWEEMWTVWRTVTGAADNYLDTLTPRLLRTRFEWRGKPYPEDVGTSLLRNIYHYWFHLGEAYAIRQLLGHRDLPEFVGGMSSVRYGLDEE